MVDTRAPGSLLSAVRSLPDFWRLLQVRTASQFGDGLFQAGLAGGLLFNPERAASPWAVAGAFAVLFLPYSLLGPFAGALVGELLAGRGLPQAARAGTGAFVGFVIGTLAKIGLAFTMLGVYLLGWLVP